MGYRSSKSPEVVTKTLGTLPNSELIRFSAGMNPRRQAFRGGQMQTIRGVEMSAAARGFRLIAQLIADDKVSKRRFGRFNELIEHLLIRTHQVMDSSGLEQVRIVFAGDGKVFVAFLGNQA